MEHYHCVQLRDFNFYKLINKKRDTHLPTLKKEIRDAIVSQAINEIQFARTYKQGKIRNWQKNENMYYGRKEQTDDARANVDLGRMQEFVHTLLSKIDNPLVFKFTKRKSSQLRRVERLNSLRTYDSQRDDWDIKDIVGKKQGVIYGRAVYSYYADSHEGYKPHLSNIDVYDFLIDPSAGGIDIELARFMGDYGVILSRQDLRDGVKEGIYLRTETNNLLGGEYGNAVEFTQEETNKQNRTYDQNTVTTQKQIQDKDKFKFWRWITTYEGVRYYLVLQEAQGTAVRIQPLKEVCESNLFPYWSWAAFPDLTEFWTPSYCDYVREIFMAQGISINQAIDNSEQINKPQRKVNVGAIENLAELKYKKNGLIKVKAEFDVDKAYQVVSTPAIDTPLKLFAALEGIQEKASGVTAGAKGVADEEGKATIYKGNAVNVADRFGLLNKSYAFGYKRFAKLYEHGVREHLTKKIAIDILGADGVEIQEVSRRDIFHKDDEFGLIVEASNAENLLSEEQNDRKVAFLDKEMAKDPKIRIINVKKGFEIEATIVGFDDETIRELMDSDEFGDAGLMSEADRDIERILDGEKIEPNEAATTAYKQRFVTYMRNNKEHIDVQQFTALANYVLKCEPIITRNMATSLNANVTKMSIMSALQPPEEGGAPANPAETAVPTGAGAPVL